MWLVEPGPAGFESNALLNTKLSASDLAGTYNLYEEKKVRAEYIKLRLLLLKTLYSIYNGHTHTYIYIFIHMNLSKKV